MARIALIDATPGVVTGVEAVAAGHDLVACDRLSVPQDVDLVIVEVCGNGPVGLDVIAGVRGGGSAGVPAVDEGHRLVPTLLVVERDVRVHKESRDSHAIELLRKPFDLFELRAKLRGLLTAGLGEPASHTVSEPARSLDWLCAPLVPAAIAATLQAAPYPSTSLWLVGETGTGRQRVAGALARQRRPDRALLSWHPGEDLRALLERAGAAAGPHAAPADVTLFVADVDARSPREQRDLEELLSMHPDVPVIATAGDDPGQAVLGGNLSRGLYHLLARVAVRLPPLRERRIDIAPLAQAFAGGLAQRCYGGAAVSFSDSAFEKLELYPWPANLTELEGVVCRSVMAAASCRGAGDGPPRVGELVIDAADLLFSPALASPDLGEDSGLRRATPTPRRGAVVVPLAPAAPTEALAEALAQTASPATSTAPLPAATAGAIEPILAALAHDLRNPMTTLKTFAELTAAAAGDEDGALAREAVTACTRIDAPLELLRQYGGLGDPQPARLDLVAVFAEAIEESLLPVAASVETGHCRFAMIDPYHARFIAAAIVDESRQRLGDDDEVRIGVSQPGSSIEVRIARGGRAVERLDRWLDGDALPWRLALARDVARRNGGELEMRIDQDHLRVRWCTPLVEETQDAETDRIDRRRRSRSS